MSQPSTQTPPIQTTALDPLSSAAIPWRMGASLRISVIAKATFELVPDGPSRLSTPRPFCVEERPSNIPNMLEAPNDLAPHLPNAAVFLRGTARGAGHLAQAPAVTVSLGIHRYQFVVQKRQSLAANTNVWAAFGAIPITASPRRELVPRKNPWTTTIPQFDADFDFRVFLAAPQNQQCAYLSGDEWIMLEGVSASVPLLRTQIPQVRAEARVLLPAPLGERVPRLVLDTLLIDADRMLFDLVWRGHVEVGADELPSGISAIVGLGFPSKPVVFPKAPARQRSTFEGTTAVSDAEVQRAREAAAAPFRIAEAQQSSESAKKLDGLPFQNNPLPAPPSADVQVTVMPGSPEAMSPVLHPARRRPVSQFGETIQQTEKPPERPLAPFPIASPEKAAREPGLPIPGAPFLAESSPKAPEPPADVIARPAPVPVAPPLPIEAPVQAAPPPATPHTAPQAPPQNAAPAAPPSLRDTVLARVKAQASMQDLDLAGADLRDLDLTGAFLDRHNLRGTVLSGARLVGARLQGANLTGADLAGATLSGADLLSACLVQSNLTGATLSGASLGGADLTRATLTGAVLEGASLVGANLSSVQGSDARFSGASLEKADLRAARLVKCDFEKASLASVTAARADFTGSRFLRANLSQSVFRGAKMAGAILAFATLDDADLRDVDLRGANLHGVVRERARLAGAVLRDIVDTPPEDELAKR